MASAGKRNRIMNRSRVLRAVWRTPLLSRVEIAGRLGLDKSTVSSLVKELIDQKMIHEVAEGDASKQGGRRPVLLRINPTYGLVLGFEFQPDFYRAVLCDLDGRIERRWTENVRREGKPFDEYVFDILNVVLADMGDRRDSLLAIGIAMGGLINSISNRIYGSIPMELAEEYDFQAHIASRLDIPVVVENDANACAWGELTFHRRHDFHDFLYVLVQIRQSEQGRSLYGGIGVGIGVVINGTLYPGSHFTAGEFRSVFWKDGSVGQFSLSDEEAEQVGTDPTIRSRFFRELARNIALIINVLDLSHLFIGGDCLVFREEMESIFHSEIQRNWPYESEVGRKVSFSTLGEDAAAYGAAGLILDRLFSDQIFPLGDIRNRHGLDDLISTLSDAMVLRGATSEETIGKTTTVPVEEP